MVQDILDEIRENKSLMGELVEYFREEQRQMTSGLRQKALDFLLREGDASFAESKQREAQEMGEWILLLTEFVGDLLEEKCPKSVPYKLYQRAVSGVIANLQQSLFVQSDEAQRKIKALLLLQQLRRKIYTTYLSNAKKVPTEITKLLIVRIPPASFNPETSDMAHAPALSPSKQLLLSYKDDGDWSRYVEKFQREMTTREDMINALANLKGMLVGGTDICLVCFEKDPSECHRSLIAKHFVSMGFEGEEL